MGRARKPLAAQKGDLTVARQVEIAQAEQAVTGDRDQLARPPKWLIDAVARREWQRVTKELDRIQLIGNLDVNNIGAYCNAYSLYRRAVEAVNTSPLNKELVDIMKKYADEMRRFASLCGLTVDSRLKVGSYRAGKQQEEIESKFGDI